MLHEMGDIGAGQEFNPEDISRFINEVGRAEGSNNKGVNDGPAMLVVQEGEFENVERPQAADRATIS